MLTGLLVQSILIHREAQWPMLHYPYLIASLPTIITAVLTKNLLWVVVVGMLAMAAVRLLL